MRCRWVSSEHRWNPDVRICMNKAFLFLSVFLYDQRIFCVCWFLSGDFISSETSHVRGTRWNLGGCYLDNGQLLLPPTCHLPETVHVHLQVQWHTLVHVNKVILTGDVTLFNDVNFNSFDISTVCIRTATGLRTCDECLLSSTHHRHTLPSGGHGGAVVGIDSII